MYIILFYHPAIFKRTVVLNQYWANIIPIIGSLLVGNLQIIGTNIIKLLSDYMKPMLQYYCQMKTNYGPIKASHLMPMPR